MFYTNTRSPVKVQSSDSSEAVPTGHSVGVPSKLKGRRMTTNGTAPDTIVLIHGFWVTPRSWENWIAHYERQGYRVLAPGYPGFEVEVEALRRPLADRQTDGAGDRDASRGRHRRPRSSADHHGSLVWRNAHAAPAGARSWCRWRRHQLC